MAKWTPFPYDDAYRMDAAALKKHWGRLHAGDTEAMPKDAKVLEAWTLFHAGDFQKAHEAGLKSRRCRHQRGQQSPVHPCQLP